jgi:hypothetical protein
MSPSELKTIYHCFNSWDSPNLEGQVPEFISPRTWWPRYTPGHWVPFPSPLTTRRATVEVFYPASTRESVLPLSNSSFYETWTSNEAQAFYCEGAILVAWSHEMLGKVLPHSDPGHMWLILLFLGTFRKWGPPLWSSGQSSWLQIRRPGFDSRHYQKTKKIVCLERGPLRLVSTTEELLDRKVAAPA